MPFFLFLKSYKIEFKINDLNMIKNTNLNELLNQALGLIKVKEFEKAIPVYEEILRIDNMCGQALSNLAVIYLMKDRYQESIDMIYKSFEIVEPAIGDYENLGVAYRGLKDNKNQIYVYEKIIEINSDNFEVYKLLGDAQLNIKDEKGAFDSYQKALELEPKKFQQRYDYGLILNLMNSHEEALKHLTLANKADPNHLECINKMAQSLSAIGSYKEAKALYKKLQKMVPDAIGPSLDYASTLIHEGKYDEPLKIIKEALVKKPENNIAKMNLAMLYLINKNFKEGWELYGSRIKYRNEHDVNKRYEMLKGYFDIDLDKKTLNPNENILILFESGIGDVVLGMSMLKDFYRIFKNISAEVDYRLLSLCRRSFPEIKFLGVKETPYGEVITSHNFSSFDKGIYWGSISRYVRKNILDFPKENRSYLDLDNNKVIKIKNKLKKGNDIICGISWKSAAVEGRHKTTQLRNLLPILSLKDIRFIDLQYEKKGNEGQTALEKEGIFKNNNIKIEEFVGIDKFEDIEGIAALISNCDIVVTSSNVTAHIAGALGKKTFLYVPLGRGKLWYWHDKGGKSIWYPSIKIFTAESSGKWGGIFKGIANAIKQDLI